MKRNKESPHSTQITRRESIKYITLSSITMAYLGGCSSPEEVAERHPFMAKDIYKLSEKDRALLEQEFFTEEDRRQLLAHLVFSGWPRQRAFPSKRANQ